MEIIRWSPSPGVNEDLIIHQNNEPLLDEDDIIDAFAVPALDDQQRYDVHLQLTPGASRRLAFHAQRLLGKRVVLQFEGFVTSPKTTREIDNGKFVIAGKLTKEQAEGTVQAIKARLRDKATPKQRVSKSNDERQREQIGEVLGKPVYRDEIRDGKNTTGRQFAELHRLFSVPVTRAYWQTHEAEITPTESEIATATAYFDKKHRERIKAQESELRGKLKAVEEKLASKELKEEEKQKLKIERRTLQSILKPPGRFFALFMLKNWKQQRHLYDEYGGGRILWQQVGLEAFDATRKWLESLEDAGKFKITDPTLRTVFYEYWTTRKHGAFLADDEMRIRKEFLEPEWRKETALQK